ncbi:MAG: DEAD/DEAH box helicase [Deltaproteobacteria bacterium]|nr:DEAD/DEAH box helicase [Deltaproteobacteria bacterium]
MKRLRLEPIRHPQPQCQDYNDEPTIRQFEREMRVHRAHVEPYELTPLDGRVDGAWRVAGPSGAAYHVDIVDGSGEHDACSCPDFLTNDIGTCKHVEAVLRALSGVKALRTTYARLGPVPSYPVVTVRAQGGLRLQALGKWRARLLTTHGLSIAEPGQTVRVETATSLRAGWSDAGVRVVHAAIPAIERIRLAQALARRTKDLARAFDHGKLGTDVLSSPLFPYQNDGVKHLAASGRALLADDMGLGKTVQAIAACEVLRRRGEAQRILIVTPASLKDQWAREIKRYAGETAVVVAGNPGRRREAFASDAPYKILNYELTWRELGKLQALDADVLILDEAQRAKNFRTKTANTLRAIPSRFLFVLTGTPVENRLDDLYSLIQLVDPEKLGPLWKFNLEFHKQTDKGKVVGYKNLSLLRERIAPVVLRRRKEEVLLQLPPLTAQTRYTPLSPEQQNLEEEYRSKAARIMKIAEKRALTKKEQEILMMLLLKARQACNALELCDPKSRKKASPKLDEFEALAGEIAAQGTAKILVFSEWVEMLKLAAERLDALGIGYEMLHGGVPTERRPALLQNFREDPSLRVLLSSDAGGVGLNLQVASYVVHLDLPWNPGKLDQRTARAHRLGQTRGVSVTYLCSEIGIERGIEGTLAGKRAVREATLDASSTVDELEAQSFSLFLKQLREVFDQLAEPGQDVREEEEVAPQPAPESAAVAALKTAAALAAGAPETAEVAEVAEVAAQVAHAAGDGKHARARNRLRLAEVVLQSGFHSDAVRASYEALAAAVRSLSETPIGPTHNALVACIYRELLPTGRLPMAAHGVLARLRDMTLLEEQDVAVDAQMASQAVEDARQWVERLSSQGGS